VASFPFIDTNVLIYASSNAPEDDPKKQIAAAIVVSMDFCLSTQVIQEYLSNALGKKRLQIPDAQIQTMLECLAHVDVQPITYDLILSAWSLRRRFQVSHWDATIVPPPTECPI
jgi:predicted nucleic acid-binding protein